MSSKKKHTIRALEASEAPKVDENFSHLYSVKMEGSQYNDSGTVTVESYQTMECGQARFSANGSAITTRTFALAAKHTSILYADAHAVSSLVEAHVTDVTQTSITIAAFGVTATGNFSAITTASVLVYFQVVGTNP